MMWSIEHFPFYSNDQLLIRISDKPIAKAMNDYNSGFCAVEESTCDGNGCCNMSPCNHYPFTFSSRKVNM